MITDTSFSDLSSCANAAARTLSDALKEGIAARGAASIAVSGGRTPETVLPALALAKLEWSKVTVTLIDERWVAPNHADSNEGLARRTLLTAAAGAARFVGLKTPHDDPATAVASCARKLNHVPFPLDVTYLGVGPDGHIASLFPDDDGWRNGSAPRAGRCLAVPGTPTRQPRMSLTPEALLDSRMIVLVVVGIDKGAVLDAALKPGRAADLPVRLVLHQDRVPVRIFRAP